MQSDPKQNGHTTLAEVDETKPVEVEAVPRATAAQRAGDIAGLLVLPFLIAAVIYFLVSRKADVLLFGALGLAAVCLLAYVATHPRRVAGLFGRRRVTGALITVIITLLVGAILIAINLAVQNVNARRDFSTDQTSQISTQTEQVLDRLQKKVKVSVVYSAASGGANQAATATDLLREYTLRNNNITVQSINSDKDAATAIQLGVTDPFVTVFQGDKAGEIQRVVGTADEASYTGALIKIIQPNSRVVTFVTGHGELSTTTSGDLSLAPLKQAMLDNNYQVNEVAISSNTPLNPTDIVIIAGPSANYTDADKAKLSNFLKAGGKALIMQSGIGQQTDSTARSNINDVLKDWNVQFQGGALWETDPNSVYQSNPRYFLPGQQGNYPNISEQVVKSISGGAAIPLLRQPDGIAQIDPSKANADTTYKPLIQSGADTSFLCRDLKTLCVANGQLDFQQQRDVRGPIVAMAQIDAKPLAEPTLPGAIPTPLAIPTAAATGTPGTAVPTTAPVATVTPVPTLNPVDAAAALKTQNSRTRIVLLGTSWAAVDLNSSLGNKTLIVNSLNWLSQQTDTLSIPSREPKSRPVTLSQESRDRIFWLTVLLMPLLVLGVGIFMFFRRR